MGEKKKDLSIEEVKEAYKQLETEYQSLYTGMLKMYQKLTETKDDLLYIFDAKKRTVYANKRTAQVMGVPEYIDFAEEKYIVLNCVEKESREEFLKMHRMIMNGDAKELTSTIKLKQASGIKVIYEFRIIAIRDNQGKNTGICIGQFHDVTERYIKDMRAEKIHSIVQNSVVVQFVYNQKMDKLSVSIPPEFIQEGGAKDENLYFWKKMIQEEKVCPKSDINALLDFIKHGSEKPIQISLYDTYTEEYRWYALSGSVKGGILKGEMEDITDYKNKERHNDNLDMVLECLYQSHRLLTVIDLTQDTFETLRIEKNDFQKNIPETGTYSELNALLAEEVEPEYKEGLIAFGELAHITKMMKTNKQMEYEVRLKEQENPWRRVIIQPVDYSAKGKPTKAVLSYVYLDESLAAKLSKIEAEDTRKNNGQKEAGLKAVQSEPTPQNAIATVLLAEDFVLNAEYQMEVLKNANVAVEWVKSGEQAVKQVKKKKKGYYDFVLMDLKMPEKDGVEAATEIRKLEEQGGTDLPIVGLTVTQQQEEESEWKKAEMNEVMQKPVNPAQIQYLLKKYSSEDKKSMKFT